MGDFMKKKMLFVLLMLLVAPCVFLFSACGVQSGENGNGGGGSQSAPTCVIENGVLVSIDARKSNDGKFEIPREVTSIDADLKVYGNIDTLVIPDTVKNFVIKERKMNEIKSGVAFGSDSYAVCDSTFALFTKEDNINRIELRGNSQIFEKQGYLLYDTNGVLIAIDEKQNNPQIGDLQLTSGKISYGLAQAFSNINLDIQNLDIVFEEGEGIVDFEKLLGSFENKNMSRVTVSNNSQKRLTLTFGDIKNLEISGLGKTKITAGLIGWLEVDSGVQDVEINAWDIDNKNIPEDAKDIDITTEVGGKTQKVPHSHLYFELHDGMGIVDIDEFTFQHEINCLSKTYFDANGKKIVVEFEEENQKDGKIRDILSEFSVGFDRDKKVVILYNRSFYSSDIDISESFYDYKTSLTLNEESDFYILPGGTLKLSKSLCAFNYVRDESREEHYYFSSVSFDGTKAEFKKIDGISKIKQIADYVTCTDGTIDFVQNEQNKTYVYSFDFGTITFSANWIEESFEFDIFDGVNHIVLHKIHEPFAQNFEFVQNGETYSFIVEKNFADQFEAGYSINLSYRGEEGTLVSEEELTKEIAHDFSDIISEIPGTCESEGTITKKCRFCDETINETTSVLGHNYDKFGFCSMCQKYALFDIELSDNNSYYIFRLNKNLPEDWTEINLIETYNSKPVSYEFNNQDYSAITKVYMENVSTWLKSTNCNYLSGNAQLYVKNQLLENLVVDDDITKIENRAFEGYSSLVSVKIPANCEVGEYAFKNCSNLKKIDINSTSVDQTAFDGCEDIKNLTLYMSNIILYVSIFKTKTIEKFVVVMDINPSGWYQSVGVVDEVIIPKNSPATTTVSANEIKSIKFYGEFADFLKIDVTQCGGWELFVNDQKISGDIVVPEGVEQCGTNSLSFAGVTSIDFPISTENWGSYEGALDSSKKYDHIKVPAKYVGYNNFYTDTLYVKGTDSCSIFPKKESSGYSYKNIILDDKITEIAESALRQNTSLESINLENVEVFGSWCLQGVDIFTNINLEKSVQIGQYAFDGCSKITNVTFGENTTFVGNYAFRGTQITKVVIPNKNARIFKASFDGCSLESVTTAWFSSGGNNYMDIIPTKELILTYGETIDLSHIKDGQTLDIHLPKSLTTLYVPVSHGKIYFDGTIEDWCGATVQLKDGSSNKNQLSDFYANGFYIDGKLLENIKISGVNVPSYRFANIPFLKTVELENVGNVGGYAFSGCQNLTSVSGSTSLLGYGAFDGCSSLQTIDFGDSVSQINCSFDDAILTTIVMYNSNLTDLHFNKTGNNFVRVAVNIASFEYFDKTSSFETLELYSTNANTEIQLPASVGEIGTLVLHEGITKFSTKAESGVTQKAISKIYVPQSLRTFDCDANIFDENSRIVFANEESVINISFTKTCNTANMKAKKFYLKDGVETELTNQTLVTTYETPESLTEISPYAFADYKNLQKVVIKSNVKKIGEGAFLGLTKLVDLTIEEGVETIEASAFEGCMGLENITIPNSAKTLGKGILKGCVSLKNITLPNIDLTFFYHFGETNETESFPQELQTIRVLSLSDGVIPNNAFRNCSAENFDIPTNFTKIGDYAFENCKNLKSFVIPESCSSIGKSAFADTTNLAEITFENLSKSISIEYEAFIRSGLKNTFITSDNAFDVDIWINSNFSSIESNPTYQSGNLIINGDSITTVNIEGKDIKDYAFAGLKSLKTIEGTPLSIGRYAFSGAGIEQINFTQNTTWDCNAFEYCENLTSVSIKSITVKYPTLYHQHYFLGCKNLKRFVVEDKLSAAWLGESIIESVKRLQYFEAPIILIPANYIVVNYNGTEELDLLINNNNNYAWYCPRRLEIKGTGPVNIKDLQRADSLCQLILGSNVKSFDCTFGSHSSRDRILEIINYSSIDVSAHKDQRISEALNIVSSSDQSKIFEGTDGFLYFSYNNNYYLIDDLEQREEITVPTTYQGKEISLLSISIGNKKSFYYNNKIKKLSVPESFSTYQFGSPEIGGLQVLETLEYLGSPTTIGGVGTSSTLKNVVLPNSVTTILDEAFYYCNNLELNIPSTIEQIGFSAFSYCKKLGKDLNLPNISTIGESAFIECNSLENVTLGSGLNKISARAFYGCSNLARVEISDGVTEICEYSFSGSAVAELSIGSGVNSIDSIAFKDCANLSSISVSESNSTFANKSNNIVNTATKQLVVGTTNSEILESDDILSIGDYAFSKRTNTTFIVPSTVTSIGKYAFDGCGLQSITLGDGLQTIAPYAFANNNLTKITIPDSVVTVEQNAFQANQIQSIKTPFVGQTADSVSGLSFWFGEARENMTLIELTQTTKLTTELDGIKTIETLVLPKSLKTIASAVFTSIVVENTKFGGDVGDWVSIDFGTKYSNPLFNGTNLFFGEELVKNVVLPTSVYQVKQFAFTNYDKLETIDFAYVSKIGESAFEGCDGLETIEGEERFVKVDKFAFRNCQNLTSGLNFVAITEIGDSAFNNTRIQSLSFDNATSGSILLRSSAFENTEITSLNFSSKLKMLTSEGVIYTAAVFKNNKKLTTLTFDSDVTSELGEQTFYGCSALASVIIPEGITTIPFNCFAYCTSLEEITLRATNLTFKRGAFTGSTNIKKVYFDGTLDDWMKCTFNVRTEELFYANYDTHTIDRFVDSTTSNDFSANPLYYGGLLYIDKKPITELTFTFLTNADKFGQFVGSGITKVTINSLPYNGSVGFMYTFLNCKNLTTVEFAGNVDISASHFVGCTNLANITLQNSTNFKVEDNAIYSSDGKTLVMVVGSEFTIPETVEIIAPYAFAASTINNITIPNTVTTIKARAFIFSKVESVTLVYSSWKLMQGLYAEPISNPQDAAKLLRGLITRNNDYEDYRALTNDWTKA